MRWYSAIMFFTTIAIGLVELIEGLKGESLYTFIPADIFGGFVMIVIAFVFLRGAVHSEHDAYFSFASLMLLTFGVLYSLVLLANGLDSVIVREEWGVLGDLRAEIFLIPFALPGMIRFERLKRTLPP